MFTKGDLLQYGNNGICKVEDIVSGMPGFEKNRQYYLLVPIGNKNNTIFLPVDNDKAKMRPVLSHDEAENVISSIDSMNEFRIVNEKQCELVYKEAIFSLDSVRWMELLKTLCVRKQVRALSGKKVTSTDEKYFKIVLQRITEEFSVAFGAERAAKEIDRAIEIFEGCVSL